MSKVFWLLTLALLLFDPNPSFGQPDRVQVQSVAPLSDSSVALGQVGQAQPRMVVPVDLSDVVAFTKYGLAMCLAFFFFALVGISFFGFDVRKARASIQDELTAVKALAEETRKLRNDIESARFEQEKTQKNLQDIKEKFEKIANDSEQKLQEIGAQVEEIADRRGKTKWSPEPNAEEGRMVSEIQTPEGRSPTPSPGTEGDEALQRRKPEDLIREIIKSSHFRWTTIKRIINRTGYDREIVLETARGMPDIIIGFGKDTKDSIFRLREPEDKK